MRASVLLYFRSIHLLSAISHPLRSAILLKKHKSLLSHSRENSINYHHHGSKKKKPNKSVRKFEKKSLFRKSWRQRAVVVIKWKLNCEGKKATTKKDTHTKNPPQQQKVKPTKHYPYWAGKKLSIYLKFSNIKPRTCFRLQ